MLSYPESSENEPQQLSESSVSRNKVKPWVFRPKKVVYSLDDAQPTTRKQFSKCHWSQEQNDKYVGFLIKFKSVIEGGKKNRRKWHLNRMMSKAIGSRSHEQCRSHHQKMMKHYKTVEGVIAHLTKQDTQLPTSTSNGDSNSIQLFDSNRESCVHEVDNFWDLGIQSVGGELPFFFVPEPLI